jgi:DNA-binding PadR family transcriptional regulator
MAATTQRFRLFILGLLGQRPMSGYDIRQTMKRLGWLIGSPSFGAIYPALHALLEDGQVTVEVVSRPDRPPRKLYSITETGKQALGEWIAASDSSHKSLRMFIQRLIVVGDYESTGDLLTHLRRRHEAVVAQRSALEQAAAGLDTEVGMGRRLAIDYGLTTAGAELDWLESAITRFSFGTEGDLPETDT